MKTKKCRWCGNEQRVYVEKPDWQCSKCRKRQNQQTERKALVPAVL